MKSVSDVSLGLLECSADEGSEHSEPLSSCELQPSAEITLSYNHFNSVFNLIELPDGTSKYFPDPGLEGEQSE